MVLLLHYLNELLESERLHYHSEWKILYHLPQIGNTRKGKPRLLKRNSGHTHQGLRSKGPGIRFGPRLEGVDGQGTVWKTPKDPGMPAKQKILRELTLRLEKV